MKTAQTRSAGTMALLLIQLVVGYEWLVSAPPKLLLGDVPATHRVVGPERLVAALTNPARGAFPAGLAAQLGEMSKDSPGWYRSFVTSAVLPRADAFGYAIEITELLVGIVLIGTALVFLARPTLDPPLAAIVAAFVASAAALLMVANFELMNGAQFGLSLGKDTFDEGVDLDTLMTGLELALVLFWGIALRQRLRSGVDLELA